MKLAFLLFEYFPYGGLQRDMLAIAEAAEARGHQVTVFTRAWHAERPASPRVETLEVGACSNHGRDAAFVCFLRWAKSKATNDPQSNPSQSAQLAKAWSSSPRDYGESSAVDSNRPLARHFRAAC